MDYAIETALSLLNLMVKVFLIVVPLMMLLEIFREFELIDKLTKPFLKIAGLIGFKSESIYPLMAGLIFGISYGGGVLIGESKNGKIKGGQKILIALFLGLCHAIFEDTLIFVSLGANGLIVIVTRLIIAIIIVRIFAYFIKERNGGYTTVGNSG
jgi:hypothetical protein